MSSLVKSEISGLFGNALSPDHMYSCHQCRKLRQQVQMRLSQKQGTFSGIFIAFSESTQNIVHFAKKDQLHGLNILEVLDHVKCGYFNSPKVVF